MTELHFGERKFWLSVDGRPIMSIPSWQALILTQQHEISLFDVSEKGHRLKLAENDLKLINVDISPNRPEIPGTVSTAYFSCL